MILTLVRIKIYFERVLLATDFVLDTKTKRRLIAGPVHCRFRRVTLAPDHLLCVPFAFVDKVFNIRLGCALHYAVTKI